MADSIKALGLVGTGIGVAAVLAIILFLSQNTFVSLLGVLLIAFLVIVLGLAVLAKALR
jgi:hypothetical protein